MRSNCDDLSSLHLSFGTNHLKKVDCVLKMAINFEKVIKNNRLSLNQLKMFLPKIHYFN